MGQHGAGDRDLVVPSQMLDHLERRVVERRQPLRELGLGPGFDAGDQQAEHVVEDLDLVVAETVSVIEEEIGDLPEGVDPFGRRTASDGVFEFGDDRMGRLLHGGSLFVVSISGCTMAERGLTPALKRNPVELQNGRRENRHRPFGVHCGACRCRASPIIARFAFAIALPSLLRRTQRFARQLASGTRSGRAASGTPFRLLSSPNRSRKNSNRKLSNKKPSSLARIRGGNS